MPLGPDIRGYKLRDCAAHKARHALLRSWQRFSLAFMRRRTAKSVCLLGRLFKFLSTGRSNAHTRINELNRQERIQFGSKARRKISLLESLILFLSQIPSSADTGCVGFEVYLYINSAKRPATRSPVRLTVGRSTRCFLKAAFNSLPAPCVYQNHAGLCTCEQNAYLRARGTPGTSSFFLGMALEFATLLARISWRHLLSVVTQSFESQDLPEASSAHLCLKLPRPYLVDQSRQDMQCSICARQNVLHLMHSL